ncbi:ArsR/SmtB family transcription factor [Pseudobacillus badius]|uniref:ArsR/SmtB family transcription factor n=1 Tax=Bacillus badius TaxID=1455 RepID=UPI0007B36EE6|nr:ArsR family transcriptional regulator [Bacillus badius]KZR58844.1 ArsR family transcriptional regulator [Bacillus badius]
MKNLYSSEPTENVSLQVEFSPVWEVILGIAGYTHTRLRHTFELDETWKVQQKSMPSALTKNLKAIEQTNFWYGLIMLQNQFSALSISDFLVCLSEISTTQFYEVLLPYSSRHDEPLRKAAAAQYENMGLFEEYAACFEGHDYLAAYTRHLSQYSFQEIGELFRQALTGWHEWMSRQEEWDKWMQALAFEQKQSCLLDKEKPIEEMKRITDGVNYIPEPSIWTIKFIPHVSYRPWILEQRTPDTKLFFYPLKEEALLEPGVPPNALVRGHKALGDELRLKLLYELFKGPLSLQEMSRQFHISKTTLHHQLSILKSAKFIRVEKGIYSANLSQVRDFSGQLADYLGMDR